MFCLYSHGPKVYPMSPAAAMYAKVGCQESSGRFSTKGTGCSSNHFFPSTAEGRKRIPSSAMNIRNESRVPLSADACEKARSVATIECSGDSVVGFCAVAANTNSAIKQTVVFIQETPATDGSKKKLRRAVV